MAETRAFQTIDVRFGRHNATIMRYNMNSKALLEAYFPLPQRTQQTLELALIEAIADFLEQAQRKIRELIAISVILPGLVDPFSSIVCYMSYIQVHH